MQQGVCAACKSCPKTSENMVHKLDISMPEYFPAMPGVSLWMIEQ